MSGGSMDYFYSQVESEARELSISRNPLRRAFGKHLMNVSKALHDIEWVDSGDYGDGDEEEIIKKVLGEHWKELTIEGALEQIEEIKRELVDLMKVE